MLSRLSGDGIEDFKGKRGIREIQCPEEACTLAGFLSLCCVHTLLGQIPVYKGVV